MAYTFLNASLSNYEINPSESQMKDSYVAYFQEILNQGFDNASDLWTIQEEIPFASGVYSDVTIRLLSHIVNNDTGNKIGDDYKKILFKDLNHATGIGYFYQFNNNYWITINSDKTKQLAASAVVKRCNNVLRWIDLNGGYHAVPCSIDYLINENRDYSTAGTSLVLPAAQLEILTQYNDETNLIRPNQRFLFGNANNWNAYKTLGGGINDFDNLQTFNNNSTGLLRLSMGANYVNMETDDLVNGIAEAIQMQYVVNVIDSSITGNATNTRQLVAEVTLNGDTVTRNLVWESLNTSIATVNSTGLVTFVANGNTSIKCSLENNASVYDICNVSVVNGSVSDYQIVVSPEVNYILQGETTIYTVRLYLNGTIQSDVFTFTLDPNDVPFDNYHYAQLTDYTFSIKNMKKDVNSYLTVNCVSGIHSRSIDINLKGVF